MNTLIVNVKKQGIYTPVQGNIASYVTSELLDEQLDEARLVIVNSLVENYPPLTEFRIDFFYNGVKIKSEYFVCGEPRATALVRPQTT